MTTIVEAMRARAEILEKATVFMEDDEELAEESMDEVQLWRKAADRIERLELELGAAVAIAAVAAESVWRLTDSVEAFLP